MIKPIISPVDYVWVRMEKAYQDEIETESGIKLYTDTTFHPEHHTTILGEIVTVPERLSAEYVRQGNYVNMMPGDKVCFSYLVVFDHDYDDTGHHFSLTDVIPGFYELWDNAEGEQVRITRFGDIVAGVFTNKQGELIDGVQHKGHNAWGKVEAWRAKFKMEGHAVIKHNNCVEINGETLWRVDWRYLFFRVDNLVNNNDEMLKQEIVMAPGYCLLFPEVNEKTYSGKIELLQPVLANHTSDAAGRVIANGPPLWGREDSRLEKGDRVLFDKNYAEKYVINGQEVLILKHRYIIARL
jgi:co-chaperonin GroES (HSP10)